MDLEASRMYSTPDEDHDCPSIDSSAHFDQITGSQMKEMEVKKLEDEITIKKLEKEYGDRKAGLAYLKKKLNEYRKQRSNSAEKMKELVLMSQFLIEKSEVLKSYHNEAELINVENAQNKSAEVKNKITELQMTFQVVKARDNDSKSLNEKLQCKFNEVNNNIARQIGQRDGEYNKRRETITKTSSRIEALKKELNQHAINNNLKDLIEKKGTRIIELEAETGKLQNKLKQELDSALQNKNQLIQEKTNSEKSMQEHNKLISTLESEIAISEKKKCELKRNVEQSKTEKEDLLKHVAQERKNIELLKKSFVEQEARIESELAKIKDEKENLSNNFAIAEESMQTELKKLHDELQKNKSLSQKLEDTQKTISKVSEKKSLVKKMMSNNLAIEDKLKKAKDDLKKHDEILSDFNKKKNNFELKIKDLEQKKVQIQKNLESSIKKKSETVAVKQVERAAKSNIEVFTQSSNLNSICSFKSDSDESEDEYKIQDQGSKNFRSENTPFTQKKSVFPSDGKEQSSLYNTTSKSVNSSESEFDKLFQTSSQGHTDAKTKDSMDVFKYPAPLYQYKRKTPQRKN